MQDGAQSPCQRRTFGYSEKSEFAHGNPRLRRRRLPAREAAAALLRLIAAHPFESLLSGLRQWLECSGRAGATQAVTAAREDSPPNDRGAKSFLGALKTGIELYNSKFMHKI
jgi:hypothetical protein